jgi:hypothetical protein
MKNLALKLATVSLSVLACASAARAGFNQYSIGLNFGSSDGNNNNNGRVRALADGDVAGLPAVQQPFWNNMAGATGFTNSVVNNSGAPISVDVTWNSPLGTWSSGPNTANFFATNTPNNILAMGYLDNGTTTTVAITNLPSNFTANGYDVYVYTFFDTPNRGGTYTIVDAFTSTVLSPAQFENSDTNPTNYVQYPQTGNTNLSGNYLVFHGLTNPNIQLVAVANHGGTLRAPIGAIQVVAAPAPGEAGAVTGLTVSTNVGQISLSWTPGSGSAGSLVVMRAGNPATAEPVDGVPYTANSAFGLGDNLGDDNLGSPNFVVFSGAGSSVTVNNVFGATNYYFAVYSFVGSGGSIDYTLASPAVSNAIPFAVFTNLVLIPPSAPIVAGTARAMTAMASFDDGGVLNVTAAATYTSSVPAVVGILSPGRLAAITNGTALVWASYQGRQATQTVSVVGLSLTHRYGFNSVTVGDLNAIDSAGGANGLVHSDDASSGQNGAGLLILSGSISNYVELPANLMTNYGGMTIEAWSAVNLVENWGRIMDFGLDTTRNIFFSPTAAGGAIVRGAITATGAGGEQQVNGTFPNDGFEHQYVWSINGATRTSRLFIDGAQVSVNTNTTLTPEDIGPTSNDWLGRSQYAADAYYVGSINEFRTYNGVLDPLQIAIDGSTGPDVITNDPGAILTLTLTLTNALNVGDNVQAVVMGTFANLANPVNLTAVSQTTYTSSSNAVLTVSATGFVSATGPGIATIRAISFGLTNSVTVTVTELPTILVHRYSFNDAPGVAGTTLVDSVGGADGVALGSTITNDGSQVIMSGTGSFGTNPNGDFVQLPADILSQLNSVTIESWFTDTNNYTTVFNRAWDFGAQNAGGGGARYLFLTSIAGNQTTLRTALLSPAAGGEQQVNWTRPSLVREHHVVYTSDASTRTARIYVDGTLRAQNLNVTGQPRDLAPAPDSWIGRSQFNVDPWFQGAFNEMRIWRGAITPAQVALDFAAGPDTVVLATNLTGFASVSVSSMNVGDVQQPQLAFTGATLIKPLLGGMSGVVSNWVSSDPSVAHVDENGSVTAVSAGTATISATFNGTTHTSGSFTVTAATPVLTHRYSFTSDATDSVGGANGVNAGGAVFSGGSVFLTGAANSYLSLPGGLLPGDTMTFEIWMTYSNTIAANARAFDFGWAGNTNYIAFMPSDTANPTSLQGFTLLRYLYGDRGNSERNLQRQGRPISGGTNKIHYAWVLNKKALKAELYLNGELSETYKYEVLPYSEPSVSFITNVESYIGHAVRTNAGGSFPAANLTGSVDEFRIWNGALTKQQVETSFALGPDAGNPIDPGALQTLSLVLNDPTMVLGTIQRPTVRGAFASAGTVDLTRALGVVYSSGNPAVVAVDANSDRLKAAGAGTTQVIASYGGKSATNTVTVIAKPPVRLTHRYSFASDAHDSVGKADGILRGNARIVTNNLVLDGTISPNTYVDLPSDIISGYDQLTIEAFMTLGGGGANNQGRLFDFNDHVNANNIAVNGWPSYLFMTPPGGNGAQPRLAHFPTPGTTGTEVGTTLPGDLRNRSDHIVAMMDSVAHTLTLYTNGVAGVVVTNATIDISRLTDVYSFIGRSAFNDSYLLGNIDDFRIYYGTLTPAQVTASMAAGASAERLTATLSGSSVIVTWPNVPVLEGYSLQYSLSLTAPNWLAAGAPTVVGGNNQVTIPLTNSSSFFRLTK